MKAQIIQFPYHLRALPPEPIINPWLYVLAFWFGLSAALFAIATV